MSGLWRHEPIRAVRLEGVVHTNGDDERGSESGPLCLEFNADEGLIAGHSCVMSGLEAAGIARNKVDVDCVIGSDVELAGINVATARRCG